MHHASMVFDEVRNRAYLAAMERVVTPESVVLDLGAGLGVLGLLAAKLGARRVYCVEPAAVAEQIPMLAKANGVADRVTMLRGRIEDVELPEQADVLVSVFTGNLLFTENLMPSLYHARDRWLKPGGALIPDRARLLFAAVDAAEQYASNIGRFRNASMGIDYSAIADLVANACLPTARGDPAPVFLTTPAIATELDLHGTHENRIKWSAPGVALRDGVVHGLLGWIELRLGDAWLSTAPDAPAVHWSPTLMPLASPLSVCKGQSLMMSFQFVDDNRMVWSLGADGITRRQSTMLANPDAAIDVVLSSASCANPLGAEGLLVEGVLAAMRAGMTNQAIAEDLFVRMPTRFRHARDAFERVGALAVRYREHPARPGRKA
jgi:SAM-dependent methyltransferase